MGFVVPHSCPLPLCTQLSHLPLGYKEYSVTRVYGPCLTFPKQLSKSICRESSLSNVHGIVLFFPVLLFLESRRIAGVVWGHRSQAETAAPLL